MLRQKGPAMGDPFKAYPGFDAWRAVAATLAPTAVDAVRAQAVSGICQVCESVTGFGVDAASARGAGSLRESLICRACGCNARQRAAAAVLMQAVGADRRPRVYATEQASPFHVALRRRLRGLRGSEFVTSPLRHLRLSLWLWRQGAFESVRREDVTALSFADREFDAIVSLDVLEHVPDFRAALREFARVLQPGGTLVLTVPFYADRIESRMLAKAGPDGSIEHLQPPEYHGDPLGSGVLCFHHFGWDLLDAMHASGFSTAEAVRVHDRGNGLPESLWVLRALR